MSTRLLSLPKLRDCLHDARGFGLATGDLTIYNLLLQAVREAEKHEPADSFKTCPNCKRKHQGIGKYCDLDCAEEDGAVEK